MTRLPGPRCVAVTGGARGIGAAIARTLAARGWTREGGDLYEVLSRLDSEGCARYVVTDVNKDGMLQGPNLDLLRDVCAATDRPVVASGGVTTLADIEVAREALRGVSIYTPMEESRWLSELAGGPVLIFASAPPEEVMRTQQALGRERAGELVERALAEIAGGLVAAGVRRLVIAGGDLDKPVIAARVAWAGAGMNLKTGTPSAAEVAAGVDRLLAEAGGLHANARVAEDVVEPALLHHPPAIDDRDAVADPLDLGQQVRVEQHRGAA